MTREEYKTLLFELSQKQNSIKKQIDQTENDYVLEYAVARKGDKVKIVVTKWSDLTEEHIAYVGRTYVSGGEICHSYWKTKKDGSESAHQLHIYGKVTSIKLLEPANPTT